MSDPGNSVERERQMLADAQAAGGFEKFRVYSKLAGPGWLQSAITLGGGSLAGALFLGVIGGTAMLWVQLLAMIMGVVMLSAISYVTLSTGESPFRGIRDHVNPVLAWGWLLASLAANMVWVLPQYSLAYGSISENLFPDLFANPESMASKYAVSIPIFLIATSITMCYGSKGKGIKIYETMLKVIVAFIVLSFMGVVVKMAGTLDWGAVFLGFIPNFGHWFNPSSTLQAELDLISNEAARGYWTGIVIDEQRARMVAAASAAVGINMTFLLPFSMLAKKWGREHRGLAIFDLSTGLIIPFIIATSCVVLAAAASFHTMPFEGVLSGGEGSYTINAESSKAGDLQGKVDQRNAAEGLAGITVESAELKISAMLMPRSNKQLAASLQRLTGSSAVSNKVFGFGVLAMAMSTISLLMLISGFCVCEATGQPHGGKVHKIGTLLAATGLLWPVLWTGTSKAYLAVPVATFGYVLLPIAFLTFLIMMNSKRLLGDNVPVGGKKIVWNVLMGVSLLITGYAALTTGWEKKLGDFAFGKWAIILFLIATVIGFFFRKKDDPAGR
ncbi:MAG: Mn2+/Fe2+ NRAMP family transporter [Kiritimatiellia bacterium]|jgi:Mn2+/Fe2+ NRAMP family transporter